MRFINNFISLVDTKIDNKNKSRIDTSKVYSIDGNHSLIFTLSKKILWPKTTKNCQNRSNEINNSTKRITVIWKLSQGQDVKKN